MKRILIIIGSLRIGGAEKITVELIRHMNRTDKEITFMVFDEKKEAYESEVVDMGCNVVHIKRPAPPYLIYYQHLKKLNKEYGPFDICHSCTLLNNGINLAIFSHLGCHKLISHAHSTNSGRTSSLLVRGYEKIMKILISKYATDFLACGEDAGKYLYGEQLFAKKGVVINNGIDFKLFLFNKCKREMLRKEMKLSDKIVIGNVARLDKLKNQSFLIDLISAMVKIDRRYRLLIVGEGTERANLLRKIKKAGVEKYVQLLGARNDVPELLNIFDIFVLPSQYEGLPVSLVEAQVNGLPIVVSDTVTKEIKISPNCTFIGLEESMDKWIEVLLKYGKKTRIPADFAMIDNKYNIELCSSELEKIYGR